MRTPIVKNFFRNLPDDLTSESIEKITNGENCFIERIISKGHTTPAESWYDQETDEFVLLLQGYAELEFENGETTSLNPGEYLKIPKHQKHRVLKTAEDELTFWLAVHFK